MSFDFLNRILGLKLYDDFTHIDASCEAPLIFKGYRPLIYQIQCALNENAALIKLASLAIFMFCAWVWVRYLLPSTEKSDLKRTGLRICMTLHPVALFPVFYASQFSSSLTWLWVTLGLWSLEGLRKHLLGLRILALFFFWFLWSFIGIHLRFESIYVFLYSAIALYAFQFLFARLNFPILKIIALPLTYFFFRLWNGADLGSILASTAYNQVGIEDALNSYPPSSHWAVQTYAQTLYLKNFLMPWTMHFYSPWAEWWKTHQDPGRATAILGIFISFWVLAGAITLPKRINIRIRQLVFAFAVITVLTAFQSIPLSVDWYFVSRQNLPVAIGMILVGWTLTDTQAASSLKSFATPATLSLVMVLSSGFHLFQHFNHESNFTQFESVHQDHSPQVWLMKANQALRNNDIETAQLSFYEAYALVPKEALPISSTSTQYYALALIGGIRTSLALKDYESAKMAGITLWNIQTDLSVLGCWLLKQHQIQIAVSCFPTEAKYLDGYCARSLRKLNRDYLGKDTPVDFIKALEQHCSIYVSKR